jgi:hypothetical protein
VGAGVCWHLLRFLFDVLRNVFLELVKEGKFDVAEAAGNFGKWRMAVLDVGNKANGCYKVLIADCADKGTSSDVAAS